ncbi:hypothetical protein J6590_041927 [Homalodisca vitripennis]|nr:hypothetical protein J6590_041927 [Homalodisca vitripennis]
MLLQSLLINTDCLSQCHFAFTDTTADAGHGRKSNNPCNDQAGLMIAIVSNCWKDLCQESCVLLPLKVSHGGLPPALRLPRPMTTGSAQEVLMSPDSWVVTVAPACGWAHQSYQRPAIVCL